MMNETATAKRVRQLAERVGSVAAVARLARLDGSLLQHAIKGRRGLSPRGCVRLQRAVDGSLADLVRDVGGGRALAMLRAWEITPGASLADMLEAAEPLRVEESVEVDPAAGYDGVAR